MNNATATYSEAVEALKQKIRQLQMRWTTNDVQFKLKSGWSASYEQAFAGNFDVVLAEADLVGNILSRGRAILTGRAGDGKTWLMRRLHRALLNEGAIPLFIDLKDWSGGDYERWAQWTASSATDAGDFLVRTFSGLDIGTVELDHLPPMTRKVLLVDGLNELTSQVAGQILIALDELVRNQINLSVIVADRVARRELPNRSSWRIGSLLPLDEAQIRMILGTRHHQGQLPVSPFFVGAMLRSGISATKRSDAIREYLLNHVGLSRQQLASVARAAFEAYHRDRSRVIRRAEFSPVAGEEPTVALELSGALVKTDGQRLYFLHHIIHDYLAAHYFVGLPVTSWVPATFADLSFDASSFDAIGLAFEELDRDRSDIFLRKLYDWNLYAAGYALAQLEDGDMSVPLELRTVMLAMLAEKRFDVMLATRQRADDAFAIMRLSDARPFTDAKSLDEVIGTVECVQSDIEWFLDWQELFTTRDAAALTGGALSRAKDADSISGWTVANVAKRGRVDLDLPEEMMTWLDQDLDATARWRVAHILGAYATETSLSALLRLLDHDEDSSVRYGSIRSIFELASKSDSELRKRAVDAVIERAEKLRAQSKIYNEAKDSILMIAPSRKAEWLDYMSQVVRAFFLASEATQERDTLRKCLGEAEKLYAAA